MRRVIFTVACPCLLWLIVVAGIHPVLRAQGFSSATSARLQHVLDSFQNDPLHPFVGGMSAAVQVESLAKWKGASGFASRNIDAANNLLPGGTPFTVNSISRMYSVTKTFTAALVLELARDGIFSLDAPVTNFVPLQLINPQLDPNVTIRQLLAHESGYSDFLDEVSLQIAVAFQPSRNWAPYESITFAHQSYPPGTIRRYSSTNYILLGMIVEAATGKPIEQLLRERFLDPLHLNSMYFAGREPIGTHGVLADPHDNISALNPIFQLTGQPLFPNAFTNIRQLPFTAIETIAYAGGAFVSNVSDMAEWGAALFSGRATSMETRDLMIQSISSIPDEDGDFLGYGLWRSTKISATDSFLGHDGSATGYRAVMFYQPEKKLTIAILTNFHGANLYEVAKALYHAVPEFTCGNNGNPDKVIVCRNGHAQCIAKPAAIIAIAHGASLGSCTSGGQLSVNTVTMEKNSIVHPAAEQLPIENILDVYPNPWQDEASIRLRAPVSGKVILQLYSGNGVLVRTLFEGFIEKNVDRLVKVKKENLPSGIYMLRMTTPKGSKEKKMVLIK